MLNRIEVVDTVKKLPADQRLEAISAIKEEISSLDMDLNEIFDDLIYEMTRRRTYAEVAQAMKVSYGSVNACVTRARKRYIESLSSDSSGDPSLCQRCGLSIEGVPDPVERNGLKSHPECCDRRGHKVSIQIVRPGRRIISFCKCGWAPRTTYQSVQRARRAHFIFVSVQNQGKEANAAG